MIFNILRQMLNIVNALWVYSDKTKWFIAKSRERICPPSSRVSPICHSAKPYGQGNTRLSHIKRRRLIMPLVALVQKNRAHQRLRTNSGAWHSLRSSPLLLQFRLRRSECLYMRAMYKSSAQKKALLVECFFVI